ncbi:ectonucleoside triphosphate diphosphohydrolase 5 isoform X2 [Chelonus insularis]|uniref:ectonucleoside triphosphate diphosphohydrolase 5 isoform X2 n=1 Tax=Chelonus insularis TaxID=460826 RepID=UPI00158B17E3|nr:ectonucleoside triphosphate diphosphohydrolase 5 isoform X2 [Chelonus insularis]
MYYTLLSFNEEDMPTELSSRPKKTHFLSCKPSRIVIMLGILFFIYIAIASNIQPLKLGLSAFDGLASSLNLQKPSYVVIIDAGSTGSRVLAFTFHTSIFNGELILDNELYSEIKPGLSSFADRPKEGIKSLEKLLKKAKDVIPVSEWAHTPISLKATAGLRLLPPEKANAIIEECKNFFESSGFLTTKNSVSIMEGADEGIYAWFTVNFLIGQLSTRHNENTAAVLDLGGGSTQVTYSPDEEDLKKISKHVYSINAFNHNMSLYTHSLLGMGLMAARKAILTANLDMKNVNPGDTVEVRSECVNPIVSTEWSYHGINYLVRGPTKGAHRVIRNKKYSEEDRPIVRIPECLKIIKKYIESVKEKPIGLNKHTIYAVSYYFERAAEVGLVDPFTGGVISLGEFHKMMIDTCNYANADQPFMCLDLSFIYILLHDCFGLDNSTKLHLYKKYNGHELSWSLGAAFNLLDKNF